MSTILDILGQQADRDAELDWRLPKDHLSASQLGTFMRCPEQYRRRYVLGETDRPSPALIWGRADDDAHDVNFTQKIDTHEDIPAGTVMEAFAEIFDREIDKAGGQGEIDWGDDQPADLKDAGVKLVDLYHRETSPLIQPVAVEAPVTAIVPGVPVPVIGYVDVVTATVQLERKTAKQAVKEAKGDWRLQGLVYLLADPEHRPVRWDVSVKTRNPQVLTGEAFAGLMLESTAGQIDRGERILANLARQLVATYETFGPDDPWPGALSHPWACGYCSARPSCVWWKGA